MTVKKLNHVEAGEDMPEKVNKTNLFTTCEMKRSEKNVEFRRITGQHNLKQFDL